MKKHFKIIYITFIFAIFFCLGAINIKATYTNTFNANENANYMSFLENSTLYFDRLNEVITGLQHLTTDYDIFIFTGSSSNYNTNVYLLQKYDSVDYGHFYFQNGSAVWFQTYARNPNGLTTRFYSTSFQLKVSDFSADSVVDSIENHISNSSNVRTNKSNTHDIWRGIATSNSLLYYSSADITYGTIGYTTNNSYEKLSYTYNDKLITNGDKYTTYYEGSLYSNLVLKKEFTHVDNGNTLKYIDLYFDNNDYGKTINFKLDITDNSDYSLCDGTSDFVNGKSCIKTDFIRTQMAFLEDYGNGLHKWSSGITLGDTIDYSVKYTANGFTITGRINLDHDLNLFNYDKIRVSFALTSAFNVSYSYSDDSSIINDNIDEYYTWMMLLEEQRLNRIDYNYTKYTILTTDYENFSTDILVEYKNTSKYLFVEYFDTDLSSYLQNGNIYSTPNYINNRDIEKFSINIGTSNNRGVYLLNHLKNEELSTSKYYFYIPEDLYFSQTESLGNSIYIDNTGSNNTNGVIAKPDDNYEDSSFANDFFNTFQNNDFGLSAVISSPLRFIQQLNSNTCTTIDLTLPYINKSLQLPCMTEIYKKNFGDLFNLYQIITTGFVAYWVSVRVYALVKNFKNPEDDKIEVMDL